ncbi:oxalate/formate antiporter [Penicillium argentinense]|uniref:Oxalate/formate antiporter n=1 Tax=Penicillium argentinense TaxID=1131581 RepID=A0A9W9EXD1_9EURO|nr:oxalate/formate antiporter [Penicillium argentinense]KAJ5089634.1 oxalate/formate antiporter [Penicillium argentinense]
MGLLNSLGILHAWTSTHQLKDYSESSIGWIYGAYGFFLYLAGAQAGPILDAYGPKWVTVPGSIGMVVSLVCFSFSEQYYQISLSFSVLGGLSACTLFTPAVSTVGHCFDVRRGYATGVACTAGGIGGVVFPLIILFAAPKIGFHGQFGSSHSYPPSSGVSVDFRALRDINYAMTTIAVFLVEFAVFIPITYIASYSIYVGIGD